MGNPKVCKILKLADRIAKWMKIWDSGGGGGLLGGGAKDYLYGYFSCQVI